MAYTYNFQEAWTACVYADTPRDIPPARDMFKDILYTVGEFFLYGIGAIGKAFTWLRQKLGNI